MRLLRYRPHPLAEVARKNRQEILNSGLGRRDLFKAGLITSTGVFVAKSGLSAWASHACELGACKLGCSPPTIPFVDPLPIMPVLPERTLSDPGFAAPPTTTPNRSTNAATGIPYEGRTQIHQFRDRFPPQQLCVTRMRPNFRAAFSDHPTNLSRIGQQLIWGFNLGGRDASDIALAPGPVIVSRYGRPSLIRRFNELSNDTRGFGVPEVSTHMHNFHSGPDSDGGPCDPGTGADLKDRLKQGRFFSIGQYYDYFYTMARAGFDTDEFRATDGDVRETLTTCWYHDHRVDHTAENVYKGLVGFHLIFNEFDTGDETTGFRLPRFPQFDIPIVLGDKLFTPDGELCFDTFGLDGLVGDKLIANGKIQPFLEVQKRRYRFRILDGGPSRSYQLFLTNPDHPEQRIPFWAISADGNFLPAPVQLDDGLSLAVAQRADVIIDFQFIWNAFGRPSRIWLENRVQQTNGRMPEDKLLPPGIVENVVLELRLVGPDKPADASFDPRPVAAPNVACDASTCVFAPICLPPEPTDNAATREDRIRITRTFRFERGNGQWQINGQFVDCTQFRFAVERNTAERWILKNNSGGWQHPIHVHLEEFCVVRRNGRLMPCGSLDYGRRDVVRLGENEEIEIVMRFRDFRGGYPMHCHNTIHEDHAMMLLFNVADSGDDNEEP